MKTKKQIALHRLTSDFVEVNTKKTIEVNGKMVVVDNHMKPYRNSPKGREIIEKLDIPQNVILSIFVFWGKEPTVEDPEMPKMPEVKKQ